MNCHMPPAPERPLTSLRLKAGLGDGLVDQILGHAFFGEDALDHRLIVSGALQRAHDGAVSALVEKKLI